ncbi:SDR family NAD(P)-dependent oxidoreductase [Pseudomonas sp. PhalM4]
MTTTPRNILITGAGSGIGAAVAKAFAESGDRVHLFDISESRLQLVAEGLEGATIHPIDVVDAVKARSAIMAINKEYGSIDVLVSNAGVFDGLAGVQETSYELWDRIIAVNLTGSFNVIKPVSEVMIKQSSGRIITVGSIAATRTMLDGLSYDASKAGLEGMTRRLALDVGKYGITANLIAPGIVDTSIKATSLEILGDLAPAESHEQNLDEIVLKHLVPAQRGGLPSEIAATIHFVASKGAAYINGEVIHVDGGWSAS